MKSIRSGTNLSGSEVLTQNWDQSIEEAEAEDALGMNGPVPGQARRSRRRGTVSRRPFLHLPIPPSLPLHHQSILLLPLLFLFSQKADFLSPRPSFRRREPDAAENLNLIQRFNNSSVKETCTTFKRISFELSKRTRRSSLSNQLCMSLGRRSRRVIRNLGTRRRRCSAR